MSIEALNQIREAEERAEAVRLRAQREARDIVKGVEEAIAGENRQSQQFIRDSAQQVIANARASVEREIAAEGERRARRREEARAAALERVPEAGQRIFERIVSDGDC